LKLENTPWTQESFIMTDQGKIGWNRPTTYPVQVQGWISERWADWFDGMMITVRDEGDAPAITMLTATVADQAAVLGFLQKLYTLGFPLLLVRREEADSTNDTPPFCLCWRRS
jgi:hypothetical protein